ncbi:MAG: HU family DNA-binding protein [Bacteroidales bacterium]|nr:HU family DNA-binding protein [Bacteroidales bacterium]
MISWNKIQRRQPNTGSLRWYPTIALNSTVTADDVILGIVEKCTLTKVDVKAVLIALEEVIIEQLKLGNSVRFGSLGSFRPTLKTRIYDEKKGKFVNGGTLSANDVYDTDELDENGNPTLVSRGVTANNIGGINVVFSKSGEMSKKLAREQLQFRMVNGEKPYVPKNV